MRVALARPHTAAADRPARQLPLTEDLCLLSSIPVIPQGAFFGEAALLHPHTKRNATIKALTFCDLYKLGRKSFQTILDRFPKFREAMHQEARKKMMDPPPPVVQPTQDGVWLA